MDFDKYNLNLRGQEPSSGEVLDALAAEMKNFQPEQIVFCGYGEPTMRLPVMLEICDGLKKNKFPGIIRLNTVGLGNMIWKKNIVPELKGRIDQIYISLNSHDPAQWAELVRPSAGYENGYESVVQFIKDCIGNFDKVVVSTVGGVGVDTAAMKNFVKNLGAEFYVREFLDKNE